MQHKTFCALGKFALIYGASALFAGAQINSVTSVSAASYTPIVAPNSIVSAWGSGFNTTTVVANTSSSNGQAVTLPSTLGTVSMSLKDSKGVLTTPTLYVVSPGQINYVLPDGVALGPGIITVRSGTTSSQMGTVQISNVAPALYTADASGIGVPVGTVFRVNQANTVTLDDTFQMGSSTYMPKPITLNSTDRVFLILYGTGIRNRSLNPAKALIAGIVVPVTYAGAQSIYPGFDQVNIGPLPTTLVGKGASDFVLFVDGVPSNTVKIAIQ